MKALSRKNLYIFSILVLMTVEILCSVEWSMIFFVILARKGKIIVIQLLMINGVSLF